MNHIKLKMLAVTIKMDLNKMPINKLHQLVFAYGIKLPQNVKIKLVLISKEQLIIYVHLNCRHVQLMVQLVLLRILVPNTPPQIHYAQVHKELKVYVNGLKVQMAQLVLAELKHVMILLVEPLLLLAVL